MNVLFAALAGAERIFAVLDEEIETDDGDVILINDDKGNIGKFLEDGEFEKLLFVEILDSKILILVMWKGKRFLKILAFTLNQDRRLHLLVLPVLEKQQLQTLLIDFMKLMMVLSYMMGLILDE